MKSDIGEQRWEMIGGRKSYNGKLLVTQRSKFGIMLPFRVISMVEITLSCEIYRHSD